MNSEVIDVKWFSAIDTVGFVLIYANFVGFKCYLGAGKGVDENADIEHIQKWGVKVPYSIAEAVFGSLMADSHGTEIVPPVGEKYISFKYDGQEIKV